MDFLELERKPSRRTAKRKCVPNMLTRLAVLNEGNVRWMYRPIGMPVPAKSPAFVD